MKKAASAAIFLALCASGLILLAGFVILEPFFAWQTDDLEIAAYGVSYLRVCMGLSFGCMHQWVFDGFLIATGKTHLFMVTLATVIGQIIAAGILILLNISTTRKSL